MLNAWLPNDSVDEAKEKPVKSRKKRIAATTGIVVAAIGLVAAVVQIAQYVEDHSKQVVAEGTPRFESSPTSKKTAAEFAKFLAENDSKIVYITIECAYMGYDGAPWSEEFGYAKQDRCLAFDTTDNRTFDPDAELVKRWLIAAGGISAYEVWYGNKVPWDERHVGVSIVETITPKDADAKTFNGPRGAGWLVAKGYFTVMRTTSGDAPGEAAHFSLRGVRAGEAPK